MWHPQLQDNRHNQSALGLEPTFLICLFDLRFALPIRGHLLVILNMTTIFLDLPGTVPIYACPGPPLLYVFAFLR